MKKNNTDVYLIHIIIKKHIETICEDDSSIKDKTISYIVIEETTKCLVQEFQTTSSALQKQEMKSIMEKVKKEFFDYLVNVNKYNHRILDLYVTLENLISD